MPSSSTPKQKKRKKSQQDGGSPSKKKAAVVQKVTLQAQKPSSAVDPILVSFPGGVPPKPPSFEWRKLHAKSVAGRAVEGKDPDGTCIYRATSQGMGYDDRRTKVCVGIYDKQKGVVTVHQVASRGTVYALQQHLTTYQETIEEDTTNGAMELFADFGSAKKRKVLKSQQANRVNVDTVIGSGKTMVDSMMEDKKNMSESNRKAIASAIEKAENGEAITNLESVQMTVEEAHEQARRSFLPPYNADATKPSGVYDFTGILGEAGWGHVCRTVDLCLDKEDFVEALTRGRPGKDGVVPPPERRDWAPSVLECLRHVANKGVVEKAKSESKAEGNERDSAKHRLRCILVLHYLMRFYKRFKGGHGRRGRVVPGLDDGQPRWFGIPRHPALAMLGNFGTEHDVTRNQLPDEANVSTTVDRNVPRFIMSTANKDRFLVHALLVYLLARGGPKTMTVDDMKLIMDDLDVDVKQTGNLLRMAGCTVSTGIHTRRTTAFLEVPLTFPKPKRRGGAK